MIHSAVYNTSQFCLQYGVKHVVLSPGSRNAPLIISFARNDSIQKWVIPDERTAGFIALGISQVTNSPVALSCTSGSAVLNYSPAVAEAFYREIPLILLSADRPPELIDQRDGQTIRQYKALENHVKGSWNLPVVSTEQEASTYQDCVFEALKLASSLPMGPVHLNIPFREPFYPTSDQKLTFESPSRPSGFHQATKKSRQIKASGKVLILTGQMNGNAEIQEAVDELSSKIPVLAAALSNVKRCIANYDGFLVDQESLRPDLLITCGLSVLSKKTKQWIRKFKPKNHLHIDPAGIAVDTYQTKPDLLEVGITDLLRSLQLSNIDPNYLKSFEALSIVTEEAIDVYYQNNKAFSESRAVYEILKKLPWDSRLHLSNSMPVRYADLFQIPDKVIAYANRGTSGIDGCTSTMIGSALADPQHLHILITGDLAFLYDRNAFFHNHLPSNIRIVVLNNQGGGIFRLIEGPRNLPELETYFETRHQRTAMHICAENKIGYKQIHQQEDLMQELENFFSSTSNHVVLEVFTDPETNQKEFKNLKNFINERISN